MTHVGEELALRPAPFHGLVAGRQQLGIGGSKIARANVDLAFECFLLVEQLAVPALDFQQHLVEAVDQDADFVPAGMLDADAVVLVA